MRSKPFIKVIIDKKVIEIPVSVSNMAHFDEQFS